MILSRHFLRFAMLGLTFAGGLPIILSAQEAEEAKVWNAETIYEELSQPVTVQTKVGRDFSGMPIQVTEAGIILLDTVGTGSVEYNFAAEDIVNVRLPGGALRPHALDLIESGATDAGLDLLETLYRQREPFFPYLPESEPAFFAEQIPAFRQADAVQRGVDLARALRPRLADNPVMLDLIDDELLLGAFLLGETEEAQRRALEWVENKGREARSALGWYVLGTLQRESEAFDAAWFTWLKPVVFSGARHPSYLPECYAGAVEVGLLLDRPNEARRLLEEMQNRSLEWPADRPFPEFPTDEEATSVDDASSATDPNTP